MLKPALLLLPFALLACTKAREAPDSTSCVAIAEPTTTVPDGMPRAFCIDNSTAEDCVDPTLKFDYQFAKLSCASRGFAKTCPETVGGPPSARFKECPAPSDRLVHAKQAVAMLREAATVVDAGGDCTAIGNRLVPLRARLLELAEAHPPQLKSLPQGEQTAIGSVTAFNTLVAKMTPCAKDPLVRDFAYALSRAL